MVKGLVETVPARPGWDGESRRKLPTSYPVTVWELLEDSDEDPAVSGER